MAKKSKGRRFSSQLRDQLVGVKTSLQQEIFRSYMSRADKVVVVLDTTFAVKAINEYGCEVLGVGRDEVVGKAWLRMFVSKDYREQVRADYERLLKMGTQEPSKNEHTLWGDKGGSKMFSWQHFLVKGVGGKARAMLSVGEDVSEQRQTEAVLGRRNALLESLSMASDYFLTATPDVWEQNVLKVLRQLGEARGSERVYVCKNRNLPDGRMATFLKYEWKSTGEENVFRGEDTSYKVYGEVGLARWAELFSGKNVICEEVEGLPEEERGWNFSPEAESVVAIPVFVGEEWWGYLAFEDWQSERECAPSELEALKAIALTFGQAIRRKRIAEELQVEKESVERKVQERTRELQEAKQEVQEGLWKQQKEKARLTASIHSLSLGFVMTDIERKVLLFNHAVNDILGMEKSGWVWERLKKRLEGVVDIEKHYSNCLAGEEEIVVDDLEYKDKFLKVYLTPIKMVEGDGRVIGTVILIEDITQEKRLQQSRDEFFAVASHELRTPLSSIRGNAATIKDYYGDEVQDEVLCGIVDDIYDSSVQLIDIVNEYLDVSRAEVGKVEMKKEKFDMVTEVRGVMKDMRSNAVKKDLAWELQVDEGFEAIVLADKNRTRQVLFNLLGNALKFVEEGGVYVKVVHEETVVKVKVYDTGPGISSEEQGMLFEKFRQFGDRVYAMGKQVGTGMGLYISKLISEAMGGRVYLKSSKLGKGSCFAFELPFEG